MYRAIPRTERALKVTRNLAGRQCRRRDPVFGTADVERPHDRRWEVHHVLITDQVVETLAVPFRPTRGVILRHEMTADDTRAGLPVEAPNVVAAWGEEARVPALVPQGGDFAAVGIRQAHPPSPDFAGAGRRHSVEEVGRDFIHPSPRGWHALVEQ